MDNLAPKKDLEAMDLDNPLDTDNMMDVDEKVEKIQPNDFDTNKHDLLKGVDLIDESFSISQAQNVLPPVQKTKSLSLIEQQCSDKSRMVSRSQSVLEPSAQIPMIDLKKKPIPSTPLSDKKDNPFIASEED